MTHYHFLPDPETLESLLISSGVKTKSMGFARSQVHKNLKMEKGPSLPPNYFDGKDPDFALNEQELQAFRFNKNKGVKNLKTDLSLDFKISDPMMSLELKCDELLKWVLKITNGKGAFIADKEGLSLANNNSSENFAGISTILDEAVQKMKSFLPEGPEGSAFIEGGNDYIQYIWSDTAHGRFVIGVLVPGSLDRPDVQNIRMALKEIMN